MTVALQHAGPPAYDIYRIIFSRDVFTFEEKLELCVIYAQFEIQLTIEQVELDYYAKKSYNMFLKQIDLVMQEEARKLGASARSFLPKDVQAHVNQALSKLL